MAGLISDIFGAGTVGYLDVRDRMSLDEVDAWEGWLETQHALRAARRRAQQRRPR